MVIPHKRGVTPDRVKAAPSPWVVSKNGVAPKMGPFRVAHCLFGMTKLRSSRLAWPDFGEQRVDQLWVSRPLAYPARSFYVVPAGVPHFSAVLDGEFEFQEVGFGPGSHNLVKTAK